MKTGYFAKLKQYVAAGYVPVSIARYTPKWYTGLTYAKLAPPEALLRFWKQSAKTSYEECQFSDYFKSHVARLDKSEVLEDLQKLSDVPSGNIILLCYEKPSDFCHRHLVAEWLGDCEEFQ